MLLALAVAWIAMSTAALFIVLAQPLHPLAIAVGRLAVSTLAWSLLAGRELSTLPRDPSVRLAVLLGGLILAFHFGAWIWSLELTSIAHGTVLVAVQPIFAGLLGRFAGDRTGPWLYLGTAVAIGGTVLLVGASPPAATDDALLGDALAAAAALAAAVYLIVGRRVARRVSLATYMATLNAVAALSLAAFALSTGVRLVPDGVGPAELGAVLWLGLVPGLVGHGLMNWSSRRVPVHVVSIAVLLEPVGATLLAWAVLGSGVTLREVLGGLLMLLGAGLVLVRAR